MPLPTHVLAAVCWFWLFIILPRLRRSDDKPRLLPRRSAFDSLLHVPHQCASLLRLTPSEIYALAAVLGIDTNAGLSGNWRFTPLQRLLIFLFVFSNQSPSRKLRFTIGWAANAVLNNLRWHIDQIIAVLDAPGSRK